MALRVPLLHIAYVKEEPFRISNLFRNTGNSVRVHMFPKLMSGDG